MPLEPLTEEDKQKLSLTPTTEELTTVPTEETETSLTPLTE